MEKKLFKKAVEKVFKISKINNNMEFEKNTYDNVMDMPCGPNEGFIFSIYLNENGNIFINEDSADFLFSHSYKNLDNDYLSYIFEQLYYYCMDTEKYGECEEFLESLA